MDASVTKTLYKTYSSYLIEKFGEKVYKLPVNLQGTCPNRDGKLSTKGCLFCSELGTGFEANWEKKTVKEQLELNMKKIKDQYKAKLFIAYFQNYTNTYMALSAFKEVILAAIIDDVVGISIATRPDAITTKQLEFLKTIEVEYELVIELEIGLQTTNDETLLKINRGHDVACFIKAIEMIKPFGFDICVHLIPNLPGDTLQDVVRTVQLMNELNIPQVKLHSLYIPRGTEFETLYTQGELVLCTKDDYLNRVITFIEMSHPNMIFQRLFARAPEKDSVFCNWGYSWRKLQNELHQKMIDDNHYQSKRYPLKLKESL